MPEEGDALSMLNNDERKFIGGVSRSIVGIRQMVDYILQDLSVLCRAHPETYTEVPYNFLHELYRRTTSFKLSTANKIYRWALNCLSIGYCPSSYAELKEIFTFAEQSVEQSNRIASELLKVAPQYSMSSDDLIFISVETLKEKAQVFYDLVEERLMLVGLES